MVLEDMLRYYVSLSEYDRDDYLLMVDLAHNNSCQISMKTIHFLLNHGKHFSKPMNRKVNKFQIVVANFFALAMNNVINKAKRYLLAT